MHPDKSDDPNAHEKFSEITRIYETLKDDELRVQSKLPGNEMFFRSLKQCLVSKINLELSH